MTWADFYLICFAVGFMFSLLSFLLGGLHWHLPHWGGAHGHVGGHLHLGHGAGHGHGTGHGSHAHNTGISPLNPITLAAFLAWFGGTGYLLTRFWTVWFVVGFGVAILSGLLGGGIIYWFLTRVLMSTEEDMDPADYEMIGVLGRVSSSIREGGTGEIIYSQAGTRRTCGARAEDGTAIAKGTEIVVTRYEKGIAYVRLWTEMAGEDSEVTVEARESDRDDLDKKEPAR
jgi:membrane protein implicated in regulation of membrane protease activity